MLELCSYFIKLALHCYCRENVSNMDVFQSICLKESNDMAVKKPQSSDELL